MKTRSPRLADRDVAFCLEQVGRGVRLVHIAHYVYGISPNALSARIRLAKARGAIDGGHGRDPVGGGWVPAPPPPTAAENALEYVTAHGDLTARDVAAKIGVTREWAGVLLRRLCCQGAIVRRAKRRGRVYVYG